VRWRSNGERFNYFPYGEEYVATGNGREKFGTYIRDSNVMDYADQRYYGVGIGRFLTADLGPYDPSNPLSWNRYAYSWNDPINKYDPGGAYPMTPDRGPWDDPNVNYVPGFYSYLAFMLWSPQAPAQYPTGGYDPRDPWQIAWARSRSHQQTVKSRLEEMKSTHCGEVLGEELLDELADQADNDLFLNSGGLEGLISVNEATGKTIAGGTQSIRSFAATTTGDAFTITAGGVATNVIVLKPSSIYTKNSQGEYNGVVSAFQRANLLVHEVLHTYFAKDNEAALQNRLGTGGKDITTWLNYDCRETYKLCSAPGILFWDQFAGQRRMDYRNVRHSEVEFSA
jgi:RHS repeat-associated protein